MTSCRRMKSLNCQDMSAKHKPLNIRLTKSNFNQFNQLQCLVFKHWALPPYVYRSLMHIICHVISRWLYPSITNSSLVIKMFFITYSIWFPSRKRSSKAFSIFTSKKLKTQSTSSKKAEWSFGVTSCRSRTSPPISGQSRGCSVGTWTMDFQHTPQYFQHFHTMYRSLKYRYVVIKFK